MHQNLILSLLLSYVVHIFLLWSFLVIIIVFFFYIIDKVSGLSATGEAKLRWQKDQTQYKQAKQQERYDTVSLWDSK